MELPASRPPRAASASGPAPWLVEAGRCRQIARRRRLQPTLSMLRPMLRLAAGRPKKELRARPVAYSAPGLLPPGLLGSGARSNVEALQPTDGQPGCQCQKPPCAVHPEAVVGPQPASNAAAFRFAPTPPLPLRLVQRPDEQRAGRRLWQQQPQVQQPQAQQQQAWRRRAAYGAPRTCAALRAARPALMLLRRAERSPPVGTTSKRAWMSAVVCAEPLRRSAGSRWRVAAERCESSPRREMAAPRTALARAEAPASVGCSRPPWAWAVVAASVRQVVAVEAAASKRSNGMPQGSEVPRRRR